MINNTLADFIARLNVARRKHLKTIIIEQSFLVFSLLKIFEDVGIIRGYFILDNNKIEINLKYNSGRCAFRNLVVMSKPSKKIYVDLLDLYKLKEFYSGSILVLSTSSGLFLDVDCFKYRKGGKVLLQIIL
jgi:ribosomal protein S8